MSPTQFHNLSNAQLADRIGELDVIAKRAADALKSAKDAFVARGIDHAEGERFNLTKTDIMRWTLDAAAIKAEMGETWAVRRSKSARVTSVRVTARKEALVAA